MKKPISSCRQALVKGVVRTFSYLILWTIGVWLTIEEIDMDYSEWLGFDYKSNQKEIKKVSTFIMNHATVFDVIALTSRSSQPAFAAK